MPELDVTDKSAEFIRGAVEKAQEKDPGASSPDPVAK